MSDDKKINDKFFDTLLCDDIQRKAAMKEMGKALGEILNQKSIAREVFPPYAEDACKHCKLPLNEHQLHGLRYKCLFESTYYERMFKWAPKKYG